MASARKAFRKSQRLVRRKTIMEQAPENSDDELADLGLD